MTEEVLRPAGTVIDGRRVAGVLAYVVGLATYMYFLGLPKQAVEVVGWIWLGTVAWDVRLLLLCPLAMSVMLVYYAEHYVVDAIAGAVLVAAAIGACALWERRRPVPEAEPEEEPEVSDQDLRPASPRPSRCSG